MIHEKELACVYAALILYDDDIAITAEKIASILKAAHVNVDPYWPGLFAKALEGVDLKDLIFNVSNAVGAPAPTGAAAGLGAAGKAEGKAEGGKAEGKKEVKKEEKPAVEEESDEDMGLDLFA